MANTFRYSMKNNERFPSNSCVVKMWFGSKYFIWKMKALHAGLETAGRDIDSRLRLGQKPEDIWDKVIKYIKRARITQFEVEVVLMSNNPQELLITEYKLLQESKMRDDCLNVLFEPLMPKWIPQIDKDAFLAIKDGLYAGQVITPARGAGQFKIKTLKTNAASSTTTEGS